MSRGVVRLPRLPERDAPQAQAQAQAQAQRTIAALTGLRAIAAGWVVLEHLQPVIYTLLPAARYASGPLAGGNLGVEVFFILSGFVLAHNYATRWSTWREFRYADFLRARFARIYPVHLAIIILLGAWYVLTVTTGHAGVTGATSYTLGGLASNLTLTQAFPWGQLWSLPSWSISCEAMAYLAFPALALLAVRAPRGRALLIAALLLVGDAVVLQAFAGPTFAPTALPVAWVRISFEFTAGVFLWVSWRSWPAFRARWTWDAVAGAAFVAIAAMLTLLPEHSPAMFATVPLIGLFVVACASSEGPVRGLLTLRPFQWGGRISYSLYMTHAVVLTFVGRWQLLAGADLTVRLAAILGYLAAMVLAAAAMYYLVEEPGRRWVNRLGRNRQPVGRHRVLTGA